MKKTKNKKKLIDVFPDWSTGGGIFSILQDYTVPWQDSDFALALDIDYYGNISGEKYVSPLIDKIMSGDTLTTAEKELLAVTILALFGVNWAKEWETLEAEYNPIENYRMTETMTDDETVIDYGHTVAHSGTETTTPDLTQNRDSTFHGFNSTDGVPLSGETATATGTNELELDTADTESGQDTHTRNYELTRSGNIGVTTSQQMLESERALWVWNYFLDVVFPDLDRILALEIY